MKDWQKVFANNVKSYRVAKKLSKGKLATLVDCDTSYIGKIERCEKSPNLRIIIRLAKALEIEPSQLFL